MYNIKIITIEPTAETIGFLIKTDANSEILNIENAYNDRDKNPTKIGRTSGSEYRISIKG